MADEDQQKELKSKFQIVVPLSEHNYNSKSWTLVDGLKDLLNSIESGECKANKMLIMLLTDGNGSYKTNFINVGMSASECISLCEVSKIRFLGMMGFVYSQDNK